ncbi:cupin domain-containing protein [Halobacillus fulvus]|nr:cupin domain-containing protein [Halobacillus fulvus]
MHNLPYQYPYQNLLYGNGSRNAYQSGASPYSYEGALNGWNSYPHQNMYRQMELKDYGPNPLVININAATKQNDTFRTALWTGTHLQVTLMSIQPGEDIGVEMHPDVDQFIRVEQGQGVFRTGSSKDQLKYEAPVMDDFAVLIPAGTWHNVINTGNTPMKVYSIYAPPNHPFGTVHTTKADAIAAEEEE